MSQDTSMDDVADDDEKLGEKAERLFVHSNAVPGVGNGTYTLDSIHRDALALLDTTQGFGQLPAKYHEILTHTKNADDLLSSLDFIENSSTQITVPKGRLKKAIASTAARLRRYSDAIDMIAQSSPQAFGVNVTGIVWGSMKFLLVIATDIESTRELVIETLDYIRHSLPVLDALAPLYGQSRVQLLYKPLLDVYSAIISLALQAAGRFDRSSSSVKSLGRSAWQSLKADFDEPLKRIREAGMRIEQAAHVEHMYITDAIHRAQDTESLRQESFRREMRHHLRSPLVAESSKASIRPFNDAPVGLLSPHFTGRTPELAQIRSTLQCRSDDKPARCAIVGMPGLGKTQLALKYTSDIFHTLHGPLVFWISAASVERMVQGFSKVLDLINHIDRDHVDQNVKVNAAQRWLEGGDQTGLQPWLLVCDNVDEASLPFLRENLPRATNRGAIIFTMRSIDVAKALLDSGNREKQLLKLALPSQQDAVEMLVAELESLSPQDKAEATQASLLKAETLVNELGRLPLAVNQAASFANHSYKDLDYLLGLYQSEYKIHMLSWDNVLSTHEQRSVMATFENKLSDLDVTAPVTSLLLKVMSFLDAESIPIEIWTNGSSLLRFVQLQLYDQDNFELAEDPPQNEPKLSPKHSSMKRLMGRLRNKIDRPSSRPASPRSEPEAVQQIGNEYSTRWQGTHFRGPAPPSQDMCIQVASGWDAPPPCEPLRGPGIPELSSLLEDPIEFPKVLQTIEKLALITILEDRKALRIHDLVQLMIRHDAKKSQSEELCHWAATFVISRSLHSIGDVRIPQSWPFYDRLLPHFNALQTTLPTIKNSYNVSFVRARRVVGSYLKARCQFREAESILLENMSYVETHVGAENPDYLRSAFALAALYYKQSKFEAAESLVKKVASTRKRVLGDNHTEYVNAIALLANIFRNQGKYDEAEILFKEVIEQHEKYGNALDIYCVMNDFALLYSGQGRSEEAIRIYRQILRKADGEETANLDTILTVKANLGLQELATCRNDDAQASLEWALSTREKFWGIEDPVTQDLMLAMKDFWRRKNGWNQAENLCVKVADLKKRLLGEDHVETLSALSDLAEVYDYQERYEEAVTTLHLVIDGRKRQLGPDDRQTLEAQRLLAVSHRSAGRYEEAESILESNLETLTEKFEPDHLDTLATVCTLGELRRWQGRLDEAYLLLKRALAGQRQSLKDDDLELLHTMI